MAFGIQVFNSAGATVIDSTRAGGMYVETLTWAAGTSGSKSYTQYAGRQVFVIPIYIGTTANSTYSNYSVAYDPGYPVLTWNLAANAPPTISAVIFVR